MHFRKKLDDTIGAYSLPWESKEEAIVENSNTEYYILPHYGDINELYHVHSNFSDGLDPLQRMVKEALLLDLDYYGVLDHLDLTGISQQDHQKPHLGNFRDNMDYRRMAVEEHLSDIDVAIPELHSNELAIGRGAEIDWDPRPGKTAELRNRVDQLNLDYEVYSVHYDEEGINFKNPQVIENAYIQDKVDEYIQQCLDAIEFGESKGGSALAHPGRIEEGPLKQEVSKETYYPVLDALSDADMAYELNGKVQLRYLMNNGELTSEIHAIADYPGDLPNISAGTDTHRIGHSDSYRENYASLRNMEFTPLSERDFHVTESQMRLRTLEQLFEYISKRRGEEVKPVTLLEDEDLTTVSARSPTNRKIVKS